MKATIILLLMLCTAVSIPYAKAQLAPSKARISITEFRQAPTGRVRELPAPAVASAGLRVLLSVQLEDSEPLRFQWFRDGEELKGSTDAVHVLESLKQADEGTYFALVINSVGRTFSEPVRLLVSNLEARRYLALTVNSPMSGVWEVQSSDSLGSNAAWRPLVGVTSSVAPLVIVDPVSADAHQRFYMTSQPNTRKPDLLPSTTGGDRTPGPVWRT